MNTSKWNFGVYTSNGYFYRMWDGRKVEVKTDLTKEQNPFLEIENLSWWQCNYVVHVQKKRPIVKVMMHEAGRYTVFLEEDKTLVPEEVDSTKVIADVPDGESMYIESVVVERNDKHQELVYEIHIHKADELNGGMWRQHRGKAPDRTGQTTIVE